MADTPEKKVKIKLVAQLKALGAYYFYPVTGGYGASGVPDVICCYKGRFFGFECKAGSNKPTTLQDINIEAIRKAGGYALVVNEENVGVMTQYLVGATNDPAE
jgi:Holliday junction resolvase